MGKPRRRRLTASEIDRIRDVIDVTAVSHEEMINELLNSFNEVGKAYPHDPNLAFLARRQWMEYLSDVLSRGWCA